VLRNYGGGEQENGAREARAPPSKEHGDAVCFRRAGGVHACGACRVSGMSSESGSRKISIINDNANYKTAMVITGSARVLGDNLNSALY
jgi:hypothetical protein